MRRVFLLVVALSVVLLCIVFQTRNAEVSMPQSFVNAIKFLDTDPKRTVSFLDFMAADTMELSDAEKNYYQLYRIYACDKVELGQIPMGQTAHLVDFYSDYGVDSLYLFSLYLHAGAYRDAQDMPQAVEWYLKAIDFGKKRKLQGNRYFERSFGQIASCYNHVFLTEKALKILKEAERYVTSEYIKRIYSLEYTVYFNQGNYAKAREYALKSIAAASSPGDTGKLGAEFMDVFVLMGDTANINKYKAPLLAVREDEMSSNDVENYLLNKAQYYGFVHRTDSACLYYKKVLDYGAGVLACQDASNGLYQLYHQQGNDTEAWKYVRLYRQLTDSVMRTTESQRVAQVENMYNYQLQQKQANEKLMKTNARLKWALGTIAGLLILLALGYVVAHKYKKKTTRNLELSRKETETAKHQNESLNIELQSSRQENAQILKHNDELNQELESLRKEMQETEARNAELERMLELGRMKISQDANAYLEKLKDQLNSLEGETGSALWAEVSQAVDRVYPQLKANIQRYLQIPDLVYTKIVYFSCMGFGVTRIGVLTAILPQSVVKRKNRMVENAQKLHPELKIEKYADLLTLLHGKRKYK